MIQQQRISYLYSLFFFSVQIDLSVGCTRSLHKTLITCGRAYAFESRRSTINWGTIEGAGYANKQPALLNGGEKESVNMTNNTENTLL